MYTFPSLIREIRSRANLTQEEFAKVLGVSTILIAMIETGKKPVSRNFIEKLAKKLEVHPTSITPFVFIDKDFNFKELSKVERSLVKVGESLQKYLLDSKAKNLKK